LLNSKIIAAIRKLEDVQLDCSNPEKYLDQLEERFALSYEGICFYLVPSGEDGGNGNEIAFVPILIPFKDIPGMIKNKPLTQLLKKEKAD
jgi:hypothetical protein